MNKVIYPAEFFEGIVNGTLDDSLQYKIDSPKGDILKFKDVSVIKVFRDKEKVQEISFSLLHPCKLKAEIYNKYGTDDILIEMRRQIVQAFIINDGS